MFLVHSTARDEVTDDADPARGIRRLQCERDAGVFADLVSVVRSRRALRAAELARRWRVRRRMASGRHARAEAEHVRRFHRGGRVVDRAGLYVARSTSPSAAGPMAGSSSAPRSRSAPSSSAPPICDVPLLDMLRYENFLMARYWVPEYGTAEDAAQFKFLFEYSPYQRVRAGRRLSRPCSSRPASTIRACTRCTRVKWPRCCRRGRPSDPAERPVLLWVDREAGHGQGKPLNLGCGAWSISGRF